MKLDHIDTPAALIDIPRMQKNIARMQGHMNTLNVAFRPHVKTPKCIDVVRAQILDLLAGLKARLGLSYLFVSHDLNVIRAIADRVYVMQRGRIVEHGSAQGVLDSPQHPYTQSLVAATPRLRPVIAQVRDRVREGKSLSEAVTEAGVFSKVYSTAILAGEKSGNLSGVLDYYIAYQKTSTGVRKKILATLMSVASVSLP